MARSMRNWPNCPISSKDVFPHADRERRVLYQNDIRLHLAVEQFLLAEDPSSLTTSEIHLHKTYPTGGRIYVGGPSLHPSKVSLSVHEGGRPPGQGHRHCPKGKVPFACRGIQKSHGPGHNDDNGVGSCKICPHGIPFPHICSI